MWINEKELLDLLRERATTRNEKGSRLLIQYVQTYNDPRAMALIIIEKTPWPLTFYVERNGFIAMMFQQFGCAQCVYIDTHPLLYRRLREIAGYPPEPFTEPETKEVPHGN